MLEFQSKSSFFSNIMLALLFVCGVFERTSSYHLSLTELRWENAFNYCQHHCRSHLSSIHSLSDLIEIQQLVAYYGDELVADELFIGLNNVSGGGFEWTDGTPFDYRPWDDGRPTGRDNNDVVVLTYDPETGSMRMRDIDAGRKRFLCNACRGVMTKYVIPNQVMNVYGDAQSHCRETFGTTLATMHSEEDMNEARSLCKERTLFNGCWIGLYRESGALDFEQDDGTEFDYGSDLSADGVYPWSEGQPLGLQHELDAEGHCVILNAETDYLWDANTSCSQSAPKPICNSPSEICIADGWRVVLGDDAWEFEGDGQCQMVHSDVLDHDDDDDGSLLRLYDKEWPIEHGQLYVYIIQDARNATITE